MRSVILAALLALAAPALCQAERQRIDLNGPWQFRTDPKDQGERESWHSAAAAFDRTIAVPGSWQAQGVGEPRGFMRHDYAGPAWYRRTVAIPANWRGQSITLRIGGAHRYTTVFVNGKKLGEHRGFSSPFSFDATEAARPGEDNVIAIRIENPGAAPVEGPREQEPHYPTGLLNYIGNWGGIYGNVELRATDPVRIEQIYVRPDVAASAATFIIRVKNGDAAAWSGDLKVAIAPGYQGTARVDVPARDSAEAEIRVPMTGATLWSPDQPHLYTAAITLGSGGRRVRDRVEERFGLRQFTIKGNVLLLNGKPLYLRGYGDDNIEVLTGFPPSSRTVFVERLKLARSFGFNAVRFHSMTPPEEYFHAADEAGLLVMAELPAAYTQYVLPHKEFLREELERVVLSHRNHPSLLSLAFGNEFNLAWLKTEEERKAFLATVADFYALAKKLHPDGLLLSNDGYVMKPTDLVSHYGPGLPDLPTIKHEFGEYYCSLPDISLIDKFTGLFLPEWLHVKKKWVDENGLGAQYVTYVRNSMRLQHLGRKYQIERVRRQQDVTGYHYWLIVDYPGGTGEGDSWEEGWFDYFWQPKAITPREGQEINAAVLPLIGAGVGDRSVWSGAGAASGKTVDVIVSNYGQSDLRDAPLSWKLLDDGQTVASGASRVSVAMGAVKKVSPIALGTLPGGRARRLELEIDVNGASTNRWTFWSFPREGRLDRTDMPVHSTVRWAGISRLYPFVRSEAPAAGRPGGPNGSGAPNALLITSSLDEPALAHLRAGGRVWLMAEEGTIQPRTNVAFFPAAGGAQGTVVRNHPALNGFPHDGFADLQFFNLMDGAVPVPLDKWARDFQPIVSGIRTTAGFLAKTKNLSRVGYVFEGKVGQGTLLVTTLRFREHLDEAYPEAIALFDGLLRYASGAAFAPAAELGEEQLQALMPPP